MSGFFRTYLTFNVLARFHFSVSYSASVKGTVANSMLFAPVPCNPSINKSSASHFCPVRVRILWLLAAVNCLSLTFAYRTLCNRASLFPPSLLCPFHFQLTQARFHFSISYSASVKGTVANSMLYYKDLLFFKRNKVILKQIVYVPSKKSRQNSSNAHFLSVIFLLKLTIKTITNLAEMVKSVILDPWFT